MNSQPNEENSLTALANDLTQDSVFLCRKCWLLFENDDHLEKHTCDKCGAELFAERREAWMLRKKPEVSPETRAKMSESAKQPHVRGAQSPEAKARVGGANFKHGLYAKTRHVPRAAHGRLAACKTCPFAAPDVNPVGNGHCLQYKWEDCAFQAAALFAVGQSISNKSYKYIEGMIGDLQAKQIFALNMALDSVIAEGITVEDVTDKSFGDKGTISERRVKMNPAIDAVGVFARSLGQIGLGDFNLTPKSSQDKSLSENLQEVTRRLFAHFDPASLPAQPASQQLTAGDEPEEQPAQVLD